MQAVYKLRIQILGKHTLKADDRTVYVETETALVWSLLRTSTTMWTLANCREAVSRSRKRVDAVLISLPRSAVAGVGRKDDWSQVNETQRPREQRPLRPAPLSPLSPFCELNLIRSSGMRESASDIVTCNLHAVLPGSLLCRTSICPTRTPTSG